MAAAARDRETGLTAKQEAFAYQVIRIGDANRAYRVAFENTTMSSGAVRGEVSRLMKQQKIVDRVEHFRRIADAKLEVSIEKLAKELARVGFSRLRDVYDDQGNPIPMHLLPEDVAAAVHSVTIVERRMLMPVKVEIGNDGIAREVSAATTKEEKRVAKAEAKLKDKEEMETVTSIAFMPLREKKLTLHDKVPALRLMAQWKKMVDDKTGDGQPDPNDVRNISDEDLEQRIAADEAFLKGMRAARGKSKAGKAAEQAKAAPTKG